MSEHTPGPWEFIDATKEAKYRFAPACIIKSGRKQIASFSWNDDSPYFPTMVESQANARLIAAAPDLLEKAAKYFAALDSEPENDCDDGEGTMFPSDWSHREHDKKIWAARAELRAALLKASPSQSSREGK